MKAAFEHTRLRSNLFWMIVLIAEVCIKLYEETCCEGSYPQMRIPLLHILPATIASYSHYSQHPRLPPNTPMRPYFPIIIHECAHLHSIMLRYCASSARQTGYNTCSTLQEGIIQIFTYTASRGPLREQSIVARKRLK